MNEFLVLLPIPRLTIYKHIKLPDLSFQLIPPTINSGDDNSTQQHSTYKDSSNEDNSEIHQYSFIDGDLENNLSELITKLTGVEHTDFLQHTVIAFTYRTNLFKVKQSKRQDDEDLLDLLVEYADHLLDSIRFDYCRLDVLGMGFGRVGYLPSKNCFAVCISDEASGKERLIAREPTMPVAIPGIGLELESFERSYLDDLIQKSYVSDSLGIRLKRVLRSFTNALSGTSVETIILSLIFALDGILTPEKSSSHDFKKFIAVTTNLNKVELQNEYEKFKAFYKEVRNPLVHHGKTYQELQRDKSDDLLYIQSIIGRFIENSFPDADRNFSEYWDEKIKFASVNLKG